MNKQDWTYKKLGEVYDVRDGTHDSPSYISEGFPLVTSKNLRNGIIDMSNINYISEQDYRKINERSKVDVGDVLFAMIGTIGNPVLVTEEPNYAIKNMALFKVPKNQCGKFLFYFLSSKATLDKMKMDVRGGTQRFVSLNYLRNFCINLPKIEEQNRIVAELDLLSGIIDKKKEQLKAYDQLAQSIFYTMFGDPIDNPKGWETNILENIVSRDCSISYGIVQPGNEIENGVPVVRPVDLVNPIVTRQGLKQIEKRISDEYKRTILKGGELLFCVRGTTGIMSFASDDLKGCNVTRGITPLSFNESINRYYAFHYLKTEGLQALIADNTRGIALKQINMKDVRTLPFLVPPLSLQQEFAEKVESIERQKALIRQSIDEVQTMFDYTMDKYFG